MQYPLTVNFTDTSNDSPTSWSWSFGDGNTSTDRNPQYTYLFPGNFTVNLTATNHMGNTSAEDVIIVDMVPPIADFPATPNSGSAPLTVSFTDLSANYPTSWNWTFGDGAFSGEQNPTHDYSSTGIYSVNLRASNDAGTSWKNVSQAVTVIFPSWTTLDGGFWYRNETKIIPIPDVNATSACQYVYGGSLSSCIGGEECYGLMQYSYLAYGQSLLFHEGWNQSMNPDGTPVYIMVDCYRRIDRVLQGNWFYEYFVYNVTEWQSGPPIASFSIDHGGGPAPLAVNFTDTSTNATSWSWSFGDGNVSTDQHPQHTFAFAGNFTVNLTASNYPGSDSEEDFVKMTDPEPPVADFWYTVFDCPAHRCIN